jgi:streptogramin lyase
MFRMRGLVPLFLGFAGLIALLGLMSMAHADQSAQEMNLNPAGAAFELSRDSQGMLWVSDWGAGEIRRVDPATGDYSAFEVGGGPSDARSDGEGLVWWADSSSNRLGRLSVADGDASIWKIPGTTSLYGTGLDADGNIWVTDASGPHLYRLAPASNTLCTYTLPLDGMSDYVVVDGSHIWLGDRQNGQVDRLDVVSGTFSQWALPVHSCPEGMALDGNGNLWWADPILGQLARLEPGANRLITYTASVITSPVMFSFAGEQVWYTDQSQPVGRLDPRLAPGTVITVPHTSEPALSACASQLPPATNTVTVTIGQAAWLTVTYTTLLDQDGWQVFQLPAGSLPWGIVAAEDAVWVVDSGRRVLARLEVQHRVYLPLIVR